MPDANGKFKGISVPAIPWHRLAEEAEEQHRRTEGITEEQVREALEDDDD